MYGLDMKMVANGSSLLGLQSDSIIRTRVGKMRSLVITNHVDKIDFRYTRRTDLSAQKHCKTDQDVAFDRHF